MTKIKEVLKKACSILFVLMMAFIIVSVFVTPKSINWVKSFGGYDVWVKILIFALAIALTAFRVWLYGKTKKARIKISSRAVVMIGGAITILLCLGVVYCLMPEPYNVFDSSQVYDYVRKASVGMPMDNEAYFNRYPHNLGIVLFYLSFVRLGVLMGIGNSQILMPLITAFAVACTIVIVAYLAGKQIKRSSGIRVWFVALATPMLLYAAELYTDSISGLFIALELLVMSKIRECEHKKEKTLLLVILASVSGIGAIIKITSLIPVVAMGIVGLVSKRRAESGKKRILWGCSVAAACLAIFLGIFIGYKNIEKEILPGSKDEGLPYSHWVMMGMGGDGIFSSGDLDASLDHAPNTAEYNAETIKSRLNDMGVFGYVGLLARKVSVTWGDGTYEISRVVGGQPRKPESLVVQTVGVYGKYFKYYRFATTVLQISWLVVFLAMAVLTIKKDKNKVLVLKLSLLGIFFFLLLWETNSRYLVNFLPVIILLQEYSIGVLWKKPRT